MALSSDRREKAFGLYCQEVPVKMIQDIVGARSRDTIYKWIKRYDWEKKRKEVMRIALQAGTNSTRERHLKVANAIINLFAEGIQKHKEKKILATSNKDAIEAVKLSRLIEGEATEILLVSPADSTANKLEEEYERARNEFKRSAKASRELNDKKRNEDSLQDSVQK